MKRVLHSIGQIIFCGILLGFCIFSFIVFYIKLVEFIQTYDQNTILYNIFSLGYLIFLGVLFGQFCYLLLHPLLKRMDQIANQLYVIYERKKYYFDGNILNLSKKEISAISEIERLGKFSETLIFLNLSKNQIEKIEGLEKFTKLENLDMSHNRISRIKNLEGLKDLKTLDLSHNKIQKIENLNQNTQLTHLILNRNEIKEIENLDHLSELKLLYLKENELTSLDDIQTLYSLESLDVNNNKLRIISGLETVINLQGFTCRNNPLEYNSIMPISTRGSKWTKFCQLNRGPSIIPKLKQLLSYANNQKKLEKRIRFLEDFFNDPQRVKIREFKVNRPRLNIRVKKTLSTLRGYIRSDLETLWKLGIFLLFIFLVVFPWMIEIAVILDFNIIYQWNIFFVIRTILFFSGVIFVIIRYSLKIRKEFYNYLLEKNSKEQ